MFKPKSFKAAAGIAVITLSVLAFPQNQVAADNSPDLCLHGDVRGHITAPVNALYPEGIEINPLTGNFLLGSVRHGAVYEIDKSGQARQIIKDDRLKSVIGIRVDPTRQRLLVNNADLGAAKRSINGDKFAIASLGIYDLATGNPIHFVDLSSLQPNQKRFPNDLAIDAAGNAYISDSLAAAIYKVTPDGQASLFISHKEFQGKGFGLNGIVAHPDGYLIVAKKSSGDLFKIPLADPVSFSKIKLPRAMIAADGLVLRHPDTLVVITNRSGKTNSDTVFTLKSNDGWDSAEIKASLPTGNVYATTGVINQGRLYVNFGRLNTLRASLQNPVLKPLLKSFQIGELGKQCKASCVN